MIIRSCWLFFFTLTASLPAAPGGRFLLHSAIAPTYLKGDPQSVAAITRSQLDSGELDTSQRVSFALRLRNFGELEARIASGEILSLEEMAARYFPLPETWRKVARWAETQGLKVEPEDLSRLTVTATSTVAQVQTALQMRFARVHGTDMQEHTSAVTAPSIPEEFRDIIVSVLNIQPHLRPLPAQSLDIRQLDGGYILPQTFAQLYNATNLGLDGRGQTIAIYGANRINPDDLTAFWRNSGLPTTLAQFSSVDLSTNPAPGDSNQAGEETMDVEWASAMAPGADVVCLTNLSIELIAPWVISQRASGRLIHQLSTSYGLPEAAYTVSAAAREANSQFFASLAALGVSVFIASGDDGSTQRVVNGMQTVQGYDPAGTASPLYPASSPYVTGVGGTTVAFQQGPGNTAAPPAREGAWSLSNIPPPSSVGQLASGGGVSLYFSRPVWQTGPGIPAGTMRCVPDVAAMATSNYAPYMHFRGQRFPANGTSVSAPIWAGLCALINQARAKDGLAPVGLLGPKIYPLNGTPAFNQMTTGSQSGGDGFSPTATNGAYGVGPNYNLVAGLGSPNIEYIIAALKVADPTPAPQPPTPLPVPTPVPTPTPAPVPTPTPTPAPAGQSGGGGGAPSLWFAGTLGLLAIARIISAQRRTLS